MKTTRYIAKVAVLLLAFSMNLKAQTGEVVDKIIAKVDDKIILKSELESAYLQFLSSPNALQFDGDARCMLLKEMVESKVMLAMSEIDSVVVDESRLDYEMQSRAQQIMQRFGSEDAIRQAYNKSLDQIMSELRPDIRQQLLIQEQEANVVSDVTVTPNEVRKLFNSIPRDSLPLYSMEYEVGVITKNPEVDREEIEKLKKKLLGIRERILKGESFEIMATLNSQGPTSANGGNLGFNQRGTMDPAFEAAALALKPGEISMPFESSFGVHIVQLIEKRGNEYNSRHIILIPKPTQDDVKEAVQYLDSLREEILAKKITFEEAAKQYSDDDQTKVNGGYFAGQFGSLRVPANSLDPELFFEIDKMKEGEISKASTVQVSADEQIARIIYFKKKVPPHRANLTDDYEKLKAATTQMKKARKRQEYLQDKMKEVYIEVAPEYNRCGIIKNQ
ncbi:MULTISPECIES: peptidylprolyl isomerase [Roseivirga]|jgi:peptidyl-prolyl cis-trans isomerase SurA|nr:MULTISPECIES: peptidylprolyl isomerase [Roseivirga]|tara:strand:- start:9918 stop:11261 length:1344 start_codon:yes stop_codon:yes gene_type:complete